MADFYSEVIARKRGGESSCSIAVDENRVRSLFFEHGLYLFEDADSDVKESLLVFHYTQVIVRLDAECFEHTVEHLAVLARDAYNGLKSLAGLELFDERTHFYRLGSCAENEHYLFHINQNPFSLQSVCSRQITALARGVFSIITVFLFSVNKKGSGRLTDIRRSLVFSPNRCCTPNAQPSFFFHKAIIYCFCLGSQYFSQ